MSELKPCPFCGGEAKFTRYSHREFNPDYDVSCTECRATTKRYSNEKSAIHAWNIRIISNIDRLQQENEQLRELVRLAVEDMKHCNNCDVCKFKDCQPSCKRGSFGCGLECECCQCLYESNFTWQRADKLKKLGFEV